MTVVPVVVATVLEVDVTVVTVVFVAVTVVVSVAVTVTVVVGGASVGCRVGAMDGLAGVGLYVAIGVGL